MGYSINDKGFYTYQRYGGNLSPTHGGNEALHLNEFEQVCNQIVDEKLKDFESGIDEKITEIITEKLSAMNEAYFNGLKLTADVVASVAIDEGNTIFKANKVRDIISNEIYKQIKKAIGDKVFTIR